MYKIDASSLLSAAEWGYNTAVNGIHLLWTVQKFADDYLRAKNYNKNEAIDSLIRFQVAKTFSSGFISNIGGIATLPVAVPAELTSLFYIQLRMVAAIAYIRGYDIYCDQIKVLAIACLVGDTVINIFKDVGLQIGKDLLLNTVKSIPIKILLEINKRVGMRLLTKFGQTGIVNIGKIIPIVSGVIGGTIDSSSTLSVGKVCKKVFTAE